MAHSYRISLPIAVLININIMLGAGIFLNTAEVAKRAGFLGAFSYTLVALLLVPLISSIATLLHAHPQGGFYAFAHKELSPLWGFLSAWSYFIGKLASSTLIIHACVVTIQILVPVLNVINTFLLDSAVLVLFTALNMLDIKAGSIIQTCFIAFKGLPILCALIIGYLIFDPSHFTHQNFLWTGIPSTLPLVIYATMGFESACLFSHKIENAEKNAPRAIYFSYAIAVAIITLYQFFFYGALGAELADCANFRLVFPALFNAFFSGAQPLAARLGALVNVGIALSAFGGAYGILFSNSWNLHTLAQHKHIPYPQLFTRLNRYQIPFMCVLAECFLCLVYLWFSQGTQVPLQQVAALGIVITYTISVLALLNACSRKSIAIPRWIPCCALVNCLLLSSSCIYGLTKAGLGSLAGFALLLALGTVGFFATRRQA